MSSLLALLWKNCRIDKEKIMKTIRNSVFETNSSSMHCLVIADKDSFDKFMGGELFAKEHDYKFFGNTELVYFGEVYDNYIKYCDDYTFDHVRVSNHMLRELVALFSKFVKEDDGGLTIDPKKVDEYDWIPEVREEIESLKENYELDRVLGDVSCWMDMQYSPMSYDMLRYITDDFKTGYDGYESIPPTDQPDGTVKMHAVWYG